MKKVITMIIIAVSTLLFAQDNTEKQVSSEKIQVTKPSQSAQTELFDIKHVSFNRKIDPYGAGEQLQVEFQLVNLEDVDLELYIFVMATVEEITWEYDSFSWEFEGVRKPKDIDKFDWEKNPTKVKIKRNVIRYFKADPDDMSLYEYEVDGKKEIVKYPKDIKKGVDPATGKAWVLGDTIAYRTALISEFRRNFEYFDHVTVLIYDAQNEQMVYRQIWKLDGRRR